MKNFVDASFFDNGGYAVRTMHFTDVDLDTIMLLHEPHPLFPFLWSTQVEDEEEIRDDVGRRLLRVRLVYTSVHFPFPVGTPWQSSAKSS